VDRGPLPTRYSPDLLRGLSVLKRRQQGSDSDHQPPAAPFLLWCWLLQAMDVVGQVSPQLSTAGQLRLMQWVGGYQQTLRGLGVQEVRRLG
jgi:hypothetical protein